MEQLAHKRIKEIEAILKDLPRTEKMGDYVFAAGGAFTKWDKPINDIDLFFKSQGDFDAYDTFFKENLCPVIRETKNSRTFEYKGVKFDLVRSRFYSSLKEVIDSFDFVTCCAGISFSGSFIEGFESHPNWHHSNHTKALEVQKIQFPVHSLRRALKYTAQGYYLCHGGMLQIIDAIRKEKEENISSRPITEYPVD